MKQVWRLGLIWLVIVVMSSLGVAVGAQEHFSSDGRLVFAQVMRVQGDVKVWSTGQEQSRLLAVGTRVYVGDKVQTDRHAEVVLKTQDAGWVAVRPSSEWLVERYEHQKQANDAQVLNVIKGGLRLITGEIGRLYPTQQQVKTATATIGIRGTDHEVYVLLEKTATHPSGTYDRVRSGGTVLTSAVGSLELNAGQVGVVNDKRSTRAMMTLLMPRLLDRVPDFFVAGVFDAELEEWTRATASPSPPTPTDSNATSTASATATPSIISSEKTGSCDPTVVAQQWLTQLDNAMHRRDAAAVVALFSPHARWQVSVLRRNGQRHAIDMNHSEFVQSTWVALSGLANFQQQRQDIQAQVHMQPGTVASTTSPCPRVAVRSQVIEHGQQGQTKPSYRLESEERYVLEQQQGRWLAIESITEQR